MTTNLVIAGHRRLGYYNLKDCLQRAIYLSEHKQEPHYVIQVSTFWETVFCLTQASVFEKKRHEWPENSIIRALVCGEEFSYE